MATTCFVSSLPLSAVRARPALSPCAARAPAVVVRRGGGGGARLATVPSRRPPAVTMVAAPSRQRAVDGPGTTTQRLSVLLPEKLSAEGIELLKESYDVVANYDLTPETLLDEIKNHDAIIVRSGTRVTRQVIEAGTRLKVIGRAGVGVDNIDIPAATERGVLVVNAPTGNCVAAAEHTIALMCSAARMVPAADATIKSGSWNRNAFVGASLVNKTLGVVGLGRIGREVAKRAKGLGMNIIASDPFTSEEVATALGVKLLPFSAVIANADFITLHIPLTDSTRNLVDEKAFSMMKDNVRIINAARGGIIEENALLAALESGKVAGAALDCFEFEPPYKHPDSISAKLVGHPKVVATPHLGASTVEAQLDVAVEIASAVADALRGDLVPTMVNAPVMAPETLKAMKPKALLAERLGKLAYYISEGNMTGEVVVTYHLDDPSEDTRLLRAGLIKGIMEPGLGLPITIVNADAVAKSHGLKVTEVTNAISADSNLVELTVAIKGSHVVEGRIASGRPHVVRLAQFELDLPLEGTVMAYSQNDRPGQLGRIGSLLGESSVNINNMTLARSSNPKEGKALVLLGLDETPDEKLVAKVDELIGDDFLHPVVLNFSG